MAETLIHHVWEYRATAWWQCKLCNGTTRSATRGDAAKKTCPGKPVKGTRSYK